MEDKSFKGFKKNNLILSACFLIFALVLCIGIKFIPKTISVSSSSFGRELPVCSVETDSKKIALSFNTTSNKQDLDNILSLLSRFQIQATFFVSGNWVENFPDELKQIAAAGHDLGNHSQNYKNMLNMDEQECYEELNQLHDAVKELTGIEMNLFRPPYGDYDNRLIANAKKCGYTSIAWNIDSMDWKDYRGDKIANTILQNQNLGNGSILLLHTGGKYTPDALETLIPALLNQGYDIVPVSQLIYPDNYSVDQFGKQISNKQ